MTASPLKEYKWPLMFSGGVTCALLGVLALAIAGLVREHIETMFFATAVMTVRGYLILTDIRLLTFSRWLVHTYSFRSDMWYIGFRGRGGY